MSAQARRRRLALVAVAAVALVAGIVVGAGDEEDSTAPAGQAATPPACPDEIASDPRRLTGQALVVRMEATATDDLRARIRAGELGGVILFPPEEADPRALGEQVAVLRRTAARAGMPSPLVAIDQEGGEVERLPSLPPDHAPAAVARDGETAARSEGAATGRALRELGIDVDLAPVLDVPAVDGAFIGSRAYGDDPASVTSLGVAFGTALQAEGVAATAKHFPGLGLAIENSDLGPSTVEASRDELQPGLEPFEAAIDAGFGLVMVGNAVYPALDPARPASQSPPVIEGLLRDRLGYDGVVVTDDLGAGALTGAGLDEGAAAIGAARAGADLLLFALSDGTAAHRAVLDAMDRGELDRADLLASCARTTALRERLAASPSVAP
jgi:beta-N-acetylhexosaminidase